MRCLSFLILILPYCKNLFCLLLSVLFCRFVKVGSSIFLLQICLGVNFFSFVVVKSLLPFHLICKFLVLLYLLSI